MRLHHVNIVSPDLPGLDNFYQKVLGLEQMEDLPLIPIKGFSDTSKGTDIYRFRFGPRSTTRRSQEPRLRSM